MEAYAVRLGIFTPGALAQPGAPDRLPCRVEAQIAGPAIDAAFHLRWVGDCR